MPTPQTKLSVNVNKVALLRNTRDYGIPSVLDAAATCLDAGAHGITVHPRPDQRHIKPHDVFDLVKLVREHPRNNDDSNAHHLEYNIEGNPFEGKFLELIEQTRPDQATLVPDSPDQRTSDHGWNLPHDTDRLRPIIAKLRVWNVRVSIFMDPDPAMIARAADTGAQRVELYTESYATAFRAGDYQSTLDQYIAAARAAADAGLGINAGHDLNVHSLPAFAQNLPNLLEVSIGHELIADALFAGLTRTVRAYLAALR